MTALIIVVCMIVGLLPAAWVCAYAFVIAANAVLQARGSKTRYAVRSVGEWRRSQ